MRGWTGDTTCQFCTEFEDTDHIFFHCYFARDIWFHMGQCQHLFHNWHSLHDVLNYAFTLPKTPRIAFLLVVCAIIWSIWRQRNDLCFNDSVVHSGKTIILNIISLVIYWTGKLSDEVKQEAQSWLPPDLDDVPL